MQVAENLTLLVDPTRLFREGLKNLLASSLFPVLYEAAGLKDALEQINCGLTPTLILLEFGEGNKQDLELIGELHKKVPDAKIVVLTDDISTSKLAQALDGGVSAYLLKDMSPEGLIQSLALTMAGENVFPACLAKLLIEGKLDSNQDSKMSSKNGLSHREMQILGCLVNGDPNKVIANRLKITEATVKVHLKGVLRKIHAANRTQAAMWAVKNGIELPVTPAVIDR